jgi:hypothetical protein
VSIPTPVSPFMGHARSTGAASGAAPQVVQMKNPAGSGKRLVIYKATVSLHQNGGTFYLVKYRRTRSPVVLAGTTWAAHIDQLHVGAGVVVPVVEFKAANDTAAHFLPADDLCQAVWNQNVEENYRYDIWRFRPAGTFPLSVLPGSAFEAYAPVGSTVTHFRLNAVWDEVAYP